MNLHRIVSITLISAGLTGCFDSRKNTEQLCNDYPALRCEQLNVDDGQCRVPRTNLIWHRFDVLKDPTESHKITEYQMVTEYRRCLELAAQIQPIDQSALKRKRFEALVHSGEEQERIVQELSDSTEPETLYFLWSQIGDNNARRQFLQLEGSPELETAHLQYALATFYTSRDSAKTVTLLNHALELSGADDVNTEIFKSLASTYYKLNQKEKAYIWTRVAERFDINVASQPELQLLYGFDQATYTRLDMLANEVEDAIRQGNYRSSLIPNTF